MNAAPEIIEGTWDEIARQASRFQGRRLRVAILPDDGKPAPGKRIIRGMFPQFSVLTEEDFKSAEFQGDPDEVLDRVHQVRS